VAENSADTKAVFLNFCSSTLHLDVRPEEISICHRLRKSNPNQPPTIVVRFTSRKVRAAVLRARKELRVSGKPRQQPVYINEHLTRNTSAIFAAARKLVKAHKVKQSWTSNGQVKIKLLDDSIRSISMKTELDVFDV
jgi:hypothetical protein